jgi:hypothetical protein
LEFAVGLDGLKGLVQGIVGSQRGPGFMLAACGALFVGVQVMFEVREGSSGRYQNEVLSVNMIRCLMPAWVWRLLQENMTSAMIYFMLMLPDIRFFQRTIPRKAHSHPSSDVLE